MGKKTTVSLIGIVIVVVIVFTGAMFFTIQNVIRGDGYITYDDFDIPHPELLAAGSDNFKSGHCTANYIEVTHVSTTCIGERWKTTETRGGFGSFGNVAQNVNEGILSMGGSNGASASVTGLENLEGWDIKITGFAGGKNGQSGVGFAGCGASIDSTNQKKEFTVEILSSRTDKDKCEAFLNGQFVSSGGTTGKKVISISDSNAGNNNDHHTVIYDIKYKVPFNCRVDPGQFLVYEPIGGERDVSIFDMTFDVNKFCLEHPVVIFQEDVGSTTSAEPYNRWVKGETLTIPNGQIWGVFYIANGDQSCLADQAYNTELTKCVTGVVTACNGFLNVTTGDCITLASIETRIAVLTNQIQDLIRQLQLTNISLIEGTEREALLREAIRQKELDLARMNLNSKELAALVDSLGSTAQERAVLIDELEKVLSLDGAEKEALEKELRARDILIGQLQKNLTFTEKELPKESQLRPETKGITFKEVAITTGIFILFIFTAVAIFLIVRRKGGK